MLFDGGIQETGRTPRALPPTLYPLEITVVAIGELILSFSTLTMAQLRPVLPRPEIKIVGYDIFAPGFGVGTKILLPVLSLKSAYSAPVSAAKKESFVSFAPVPNFISLRAILATPKAMAKRMLEIVTAKSITKPLLFFIFLKFIFIIAPN